MTTSKEMNWEQKEMKGAGILIMFLGVVFVYVNYEMFKISFLDFYEVIILGIISVFIFMIGFVGYFFPDKMINKNVEG